MNLKVGLFFTTVGIALASLILILGHVPSKKPVSNSASEVPGGCIDVYLTGEPWSSDIQIGEFRKDGFVEIGHLGGLFQPHSVRIPVGAGVHHLMIGYYPYGQPTPKPGVEEDFRRDLDVNVGSSIGRRIHVHNESTSSEMTGLRSAKVHMDFSAVVEDVPSSREK